MSGIFGKPEVPNQENPWGVKVLFLHGLEGRGREGSKSKHLIKEWGALVPPLRTDRLVSLKNECNGDWTALDQKKIDEAFSDPYEDAKDAVRYAKPDIVVGSSMGGAILFRLISEGVFEGVSVFCAPATANLLSASYIKKTLDEKREKLSGAVWLLGELDTVVSNSINISLARATSGSVIVSPSDGHRLNKALNSNILDAAILTALEISSAQ